MVLHYGIPYVYHALTPYRTMLYYLHRMFLYGIFKVLYHSIPHSYHAILSYGTIVYHLHTMHSQCVVIVLYHSIPNFYDAITMVHHIFTIFSSGDNMVV